MNEQAEPGPIVIGAGGPEAAADLAYFEPGPIEIPRRWEEPSLVQPLTVTDRKPRPGPSLAGPASAVLLVATLGGAVALALKPDRPVNETARATVMLSPNPTKVAPVDRAGEAPVIFNAGPMEGGSGRIRLRAPADAPAQVAPAVQAPTVFAQEPPRPTAAPSPQRLALPRIDPVAPMEGAERQVDPAARLRLEQAAERLQLAYDRAMASAPDRNQLHNDQDRWLANHPREIDDDETALAAYTRRAEELEAQERGQRGPGLLRRLLR